MIDGIRSRQKHFRITVCILLLLILILACTQLIYGRTIYSPAQIWDAIFGSGENQFTILTLRIPRMLTGLLVGLAFGMSGNTFQRLLGNPLASPDIIGISSGASVAAVFTILILGLSGPVVSVIALLFGLLVACTIFLLGHDGHGSHYRLILIGIGMQAFLTSLTSWMILKASEYDVATALRWMSGSLNGSRLENIPVLLVAVLAFGAVILAYARHLEIIELGDAFAHTLGSNPGRVTFILMIAALGLNAFATAASGPIASIAFLSGPIATRIAGHHRYTTLASGMVGAILVLSADLIGQYAFTANYPVGVITGILGAPYLLYLLIRMNKKGVRG